MSQPLAVGSVPRSRDTSVLENSSPRRTLQLLRNYLHTLKFEFGRDCLASASDCVGPGTQIDWGRNTSY